MKKAKYYFGEFLKVVPVSLAIWRGIEAYQLSKIPVKIRKPLLDLGCSFGEFAGIFYKSSIEVGIDIDNKDLFRAQKLKKYKKLICVDAREMVFNDNTFNTILSNSVLEHIPGVGQVFKECFRILKPGGYLIYTVPIDKLYDNLFFTSLFEKLGLRWIGRIYYRYYNKIFKHYNMFPQIKWITLTKNAGFSIILVKPILSRKATRWFDLLLLPALPSQLCRWFFGDRLIVKIPGKIWLANKIFGNLISEESNEGSNLIIVARKI